MQLHNSVRFVITHSSRHVSNVYYADHLIRSNNPNQFDELQAWLFVLLNAEIICCHNIEILNRIWLQTFSRPNDSSLAKLFQLFLIVYILTSHNEKFLATLMMFLSHAWSLHIRNGASFHFLAFFFTLCDGTERKRLVAVSTGWVDELTVRCGLL